MTTEEFLAGLRAARERGMQSLCPPKPKIMVGAGSCGLAAGAEEVRQALVDEIQRRGADIAVTDTGCLGFCQKEPVVDVIRPDAPRIVYCEMDPKKARRLVEAIEAGEVIPEWALCKMEEEELIVDGTRLKYGGGNGRAEMNGISDYHAVPFFAKQQKVVLRNCGHIDPRNVGEYIARGGYTTLYRVLTEWTPETVIDEITRSGLRGRGGAGFSTGKKWQACRQAPGESKYIVCNADEGDPGAYMDRSVLEGDPHSVLEGMTIGAYAIGAHQGYIYVRSEYPLAVANLQRAIAQAEEWGLLGDNILGTGFKFRVELVRGAGAFVCGEETALIASIEGRVGEPRQRPPFPAHSGLWDKPTNINNVKTWANVPVILARGADWFAQMGTQRSKGTMVFSLVGRVCNTGLAEVPMGITIRELVYDIGGGIRDDKRLKAVQTGGPSGGCVPAELTDLPVDYERLTEVGSMMGSGGMVVMDETTCMVDVAKYFLGFTRDESCGKCTPCREGTKRMLEILERITAGEGEPGDVDILEELAVVVKDASLCGLGQTAPNPVLTTLRYFRDEYDAHVNYKRCPASVCRGIISCACKYSCPLGTDVPTFVALAARRRYREAFDVIRRVNPFPITSGYVCHHPCEDRCESGKTGDSIAIKALKRFIADQELSAGFRRLPPTRVSRTEKVAIVGAGPAGLAAAFDLTAWGYPVTLFEAEPVPGGLLTLVIPEYRLPRSIVNMEIRALQEAGVRIRTGVRVGKDFSIDDLFKQGYKAALIATGAHKGLKLGIPGEDADGVVQAVDFLWRAKAGEKLDLGERVVVVGGGNSAIDAARSAWRLGPKSVTVIYRRTRPEMPAIKTEAEAAVEEGVRFQFLTSPKRVLSEYGRVIGLECVRMELGPIDRSGRRRPIEVPGSEFTIEADTLMLAIGEEPDLSFLPAGHGLQIASDNTLQVDPETMATNRPGIFAAGDIVAGPRTIADAMAKGKIAAQSIDRYLRGQSLIRDYRVTQPSPYVEPLVLTEEELEELARPPMPRLPVAERVGSFAQVELGYTEEMGTLEAKRCLRCDLQGRSPAPSSESVASR